MRFQAREFAVAIAISNPAALPSQKSLFSTLHVAFVLLLIEFAGGLASRFPDGVQFLVGLIEIYAGALIHIGLRDGIGAIELFFRRASEVAVSKSVRSMKV